MKTPLTLFSVIAAIAVTAHASAAPSNPVSRVVDLLKSLSAKIENEGKAEEALYESFLCWAKSVIAGKTASNDAAQVRINSLETVIADLDSGKTELTSERTDLEKEIKTLMEDKESIAAQRKSDQADFEKAESEMKLAIKALEKAIQVLGTATKNHTEGTLLSTRAQVRQGIVAAGGLASLERQALVINKAVELGNRFLRKGDAAFLRRLLTGDVPDVDWKKLNRKATFKMSYKARSFKIQEVLADMLKTFQKNLAGAQAKESADITAFNELTGTKDGQLQTAQGNYADMAVEKGAKGEAREEASTELDALKAQISADSKFITQTQDSLVTKTAEWKARQELRAGELAAISKAISYLHSDDARDLMKKSFASHGYLLLQKSERGLDKASALLIRLASATKDRRLLAIAPFSQKEKEAIAPAIEAVDMLIQQLKDDEANDLKKKESCETERAADTRDAILKARLIDEKTDAITGLTENIQELSASIAATEKSQATTRLELQEAQTNRDAEHKDYLASKQDDQDAAGLVKQAEETLSGFYKKNNLMLAQGAALLKQPVESVAGEAPPPPPKTWQGGYLGATAEQTGIIAILNIVYEDIQKDISKADAEEKASNNAFLDFKQMAEAEIAADETTLGKLRGNRGSKMSDRSTATQERSTAKATLNSLLDAIESKASSGCDYFAINYKIRAANRQIELDGLTKAKAYLQGGEFSKVDENREIKPGDAASAALLESRGRKPRQQKRLMR